jgi:hypothetical protein
MMKELQSGRGKNMFFERIRWGLCLTSTLLAGGGPSGGGGGTTTGVTAPNAVEVRTLSERVPAGGTVQFKFLFTQPRPIGSSGSSFSTFGFDVNGVSISSPLGDSAGAAVWRNGKLYISVVSPTSDFGTSDYPFLTATLSVPATTQVGSTYPIALSDATFIGPAGPLTFTDPKPGVLTIGGSVSIHNVVPGGGTWPAGTVVKVEGTGFVPLTKITGKMRMSNAVYDSPTEMHFTLLDSSTTMDMQPLTATNPDGSQLTYYSYLRGVPVKSPSTPLLQLTDPIFPLQTHGISTIGPLGAMGSGQYAAFAVQNPTQGPVVVTFFVNSTGEQTTVTLPPLGRVMDELTALLGGVALSPADTVTVFATAGVQMLGLLCDDNAATVAPFLPQF